MGTEPGTSITNAIEMVAAAVQRSEFPEGREFNLIEHYPDTVDRRGSPTYAPTFAVHGPKTRLCTAE